jgi:hypothetical protein
LEKPQTNPRFQPGCILERLDLKMYARTVRPENERVLEGMCYLSGAEEKDFVPVKVVMRRIGDEGAEDSFLILATRGIDPGKVTALYERRWEKDRTSFAMY